MAASCDTFCDLCNENHITKPAEHWCPECEEGYCSDCLKPHSMMKSTKGHEVIDIDSYRQLQSFLPKLSRLCEVHDKEYHIYCPDHESLCCPVCTINTHKQCTRLMAMEEAIKTSKTSASLEQLESSLTNIVTNMIKVQSDREINIATMDEQGKVLDEKIKQRRRMINSHLDQIEEKLHGEVSTEKEKAVSRIQNTLQKISESKNKVQALQQNLLAVKKYGSDIQTFLCCRTLEAELIKQETFMKALEQNDSLNQISIQVEFDNKISDLSSIPVFGTISTQFRPQTVVLNTDRDKQAQIMAAIRQRHTADFRDIKVSLKTKLNIPSKTCGLNVMGSIICSSGKILFTDHDNKRFVIMNNNGTIYKEITDISGNPRDVTEIDDRTVAVSSSNCIQIIDLDTQNVEVSIKTSTHFYGVVHQGGCVFWCEVDMGIRMLGLSTKNISTVVGHGSVYPWSYIAASTSNLYVTNDVTHVVTCYSIRGEKIWEYKHPSISYPRCVTLDNNSNVYVASAGSNSVVIISSDGKECRKLINTEDKESEVWGIYYDKTGNNLLVSFTNGTAFLYSVS